VCLLVVEAKHTPCIHDRDYLRQNQDIESSLMTLTRSFQKHPHRLSLSLLHTHTPNPFSVGSNSCCQQPHQLSNIPLKNCLADFSIYELAVEQHLSRNYTTVTDNFHTNHQEKLKTDPKLCKGTFPLCENLAKHLLHCFSAKQQGRMSKEKDA